MKILEEKILKEGEVLPGNVLKVGSFLNQQIDIDLMDKMGEEFLRLFKDDGVNKILTIEASGIAVAAMTARHFGCPVVFAKKSISSNLLGDNYYATGYSFTNSHKFTAIVPKKYLSKTDRVLILDDFMANGEALSAMKSIVEQSGATLVGAGIVIEKTFLHGGDKLREDGLRIETLAKITSLDDGKIVFES